MKWNVPSRDCQFSAMRCGRQPAESLHEKRESPQADPLATKLGRESRQMVVRHAKIGMILLGVIFANCSVASALGDEMPASREQDDAANQLAREVFASDEYWWKRTADVKSTSMIGRLFTFIYEYVIGPALQAISDFLEWIFNHLFDGLRLPHGDWSNGIPFLWVVIALLILFISWRMFASLRNRSIGHTKQVVPAATNFLPQADQLLEQARIALAQGDHRSAIRLVFLSLLAWLQDQGQLKYDPSRSNREYQRDLRGRPESASIFRAAADPFERCWYGGRDLSAAQVQNVIALCGKQFQGAKESE